MFTVPNCSITVGSSPSWATVAANGQMTGHAILSIAVADNQTGSARTGSIMIGSQTFSLSQVGGTNPVSNGAIVNFAQNGQCLTVPSGYAYAINTSACDPNNSAQQFTLVSVVSSGPRAGMAYGLRNAASGECFDIPGNTPTFGAALGSYYCNSPISPNQTFILQPQLNGQWSIIGLSSQACLTATPTAGTWSACSSSTTYTVTNLSQVPAPTFNPPAGNYSTGQTLPVAISDTASGASIYYTTDGSPPNTSSTLYSGPVSVSTAETINAIAVLNNVSSIVSSASYTFGAAQTQTITFGALTNLTYGAAPVTLTATAASGLPVSYSVAGPASINGSTLSILGIGTVTVTASQAGNSTFSTATPASQSFSVTPAVLTVRASDASRPAGTANPKFTYTITGLVNGDLPVVVTGTAALTSSANKNSPGGTYPITFSSKNLSANNYTFNYINGTLTVSSLLPQTISFRSLPDRSFNVGSIIVSATASSGLPVSFFSTSTDVCTIFGNYGDLRFSWSLQHSGLPGRQRDLRCRASRNANIRD